jgi:hypothetical protein
MMNTQKLDLNAMMFSPNFDEYSEILISTDKKSFRFPIWSAVWGTLLGTAIASSLTYTLLANRGFQCLRHHSTADAVKPIMLSR